MACSKPLMIEDRPVACRSCDYCVGRRVRSWCVRAMMEKAVFPHTFVLALTYSEDTEHSRRSARMFDYQDVSDFIKRLRRQMDYHLDAKGALSFIAAGEQGERFKRCHWHVVLFGQVDFLTLGEWRGPKGRITSRDDLISPVLGNPWRRNWSLWPHGFVTVQEPDYYGMRYAMAYALKDQFNVRNSRETAREDKAEVFGTGYLAMSKKPPIGARFVDSYLAECDARGVVPPSRKLVVPGVDRPWWPTGALCDQLLAGFAAINRQVRERTGRDAAGWSTLLYEARDSVDDLETLGVQSEQEEQVFIEGREAAYWGGKRTAIYELREKRRRCGSSEACSLCLRGRTDLEAFGIQEVPGTHYSRFHREGESCEAFGVRQRDNKLSGPNPLCGLYADPVLRPGDFSDVFKQSAG